MWMELVYHYHSIQNPWEAFCLASMDMDFLTEKLGFPPENQQKHQLSTSLGEKIIEQIEPTKFCSGSQKNCWKYGGIGTYRYAF